MPYRINKIYCASERCSRGPSYVGLEPMYAIPYNHRYHFFCGECFREILAKFGVDLKHDLMNLLTHVSGYDAYYNFMDSYVKKKNR